MATLSLIDDAHIAPLFVQCNIFVATQHDIGGHELTKPAEARARSHAISGRTAAPPLLTNG
jgi:hypothetical protein